MTTSQTQMKQAAARHALALVDDGMVIGLGTGSTTAFFVQYLGEALQQGRLRDIRGVPTSERTARQAQALGIPLVSLDDVSAIDLAIDGADEVDPQLNLIKGLGKALLREKLVEIHARAFWVIVDESKLVERLGEHVPLPVEIAPFGARATVRWLNSLPGVRAEHWLREDGQPWITDNGHYLALCWFDDGIPNPRALARTLSAWPGVMEHGLFIDMATGAIVATPEGVKTMVKNPRGVAG
ncbi:MAG TPA: ribose-5-phosphate isomerase RpiA [Anaerolineae bacterium]|nr:ribose-5-phosphate isomerase RpiA [Anaerolineae bacterium]